MSILLEFICRFTAPFHTAAHQFSNVLTCAPWVPGTAIRGAALRWLIDQHCSRVEELHQDNPAYHDRCDVECPIRALVVSDSPVRYSFGFFDEKDPATHPRLFTRVSIARDTRSAAEAGLVSLEVRRGRFSFQVECPADLTQHVADGVRGAGQYGIGRNRGIGWGRFVVESCCYAKPSEVNPQPTMRWRFRTPYVLRPNQSEVFTPQTLQRDVDEVLGTEHGLLVGDCQAEVKSLAYLRRWSYEKDGRENRLMAQEGSAVTVTFSQAPTPDQLRALMRGIGEWGRAGWGSFEEA